MWPCWRIWQWGVLGVGFGPGRVRLIPNLDTDTAGVDRAIAALNSYAGGR